MAKQERRAHAVDPDLKERAGNRLKRIEGQLRGVARMIEEERYCADVLVQISAIQESLRSVSQLLLRNHLEHCATAAIGSNDASRRNAMYDELSDLYFKYVR